MAVFTVCATLGELDEHNPNSWVRYNEKDPNRTTNVRLQVMLNDKDKQLMEVMDTATYVIVFFLLISS